MPSRQQAPDRSQQIQTGNPEIVMGHVIRPGSDAECALGLSTLVFITLYRCYTMDQTRRL